MRKFLLKATPFLLAALAAFGFFCSCEGHDHSFENFRTVIAPTCENGGVERGECECGEFSERATAPSGHTPKKQITREPTCESDGEYLTVCDVCGKELDRGRVEKLGHALTSHPAKAATCTAAGNEEYADCARCGHTTYKELTRLPHTPTKAADCTTAQTCTSCGETLAPALGHREQILTGKEATCKKSGISEGKKCTVCGEVTVEQIELPKRAHVPTLKSGFAATCESEGRSDSIVCGECGEVLAEAVDIPLRAHSYGGALDRECDFCRHTREVGENACIHREQVTARKLDSACDSYGLTQGVVCEDCGEVLVQREVIDPKSHSEKNVVGYSPLCDMAGLSEGSACFYCGVIIKAQEIILPLGHSETEDKPTAPSCDVGGLCAGKHCAVCGEVTVKQNAISPMGHQKIYHEGKVPTCEEKGFAAYETCEVCAYSTYLELPAVGHVEVTDLGRQATCTESGVGEGSHCSLCGKVTAVGDVIAPAGHSFGRWHSLDAGCADMEVFARVCKVCLLVECDDSPHSLTVAAKSATCERSGELTLFCSDCGKVAGKDSLVPMEHDLVFSVTDSGHSEKCQRAGCGYKTAVSAHRAETKSACEDAFCADCGHLIRKGSGHKMSSAYKSDGENHWRECRNSGCDYREDVSAHKNSAAVCSSARLRCSVCLAYYTPESTHKLGEWYSATPTSTRRDCALCGYYEVKFTD